MYKIRRKKTNGEWEVFDNVFQATTESYDYRNTEKEGFEEWLENALGEDYEIEKLET